MPKINRTIIDKLEPEGADKWIWDSEVQGFGVRVQASGRKTYVVRYRNKFGTQRKMSIGRCTDMPPDKARQIARDVFSEVARGRDPSKDKKAAREAATITDLRDLYLNEHAYVNKKGQSARNDYLFWKNHIMPAFGQMKAAEITPDDVLKFHQRLKHKATAANRSVCCLRISYRMAIKRGWATENPCVGIKMHKEGVRETILSRDQVKALLGELDSGKHHWQFCLLIRLLILTGARLNEICRAKSEWVDLDRKIIALPDSKTGARTIRLPQAACELLWDVHTREWVIPSLMQLNKCLSNPFRLWKPLRKKIGAPTLRIHDLRHTFGSHAHRAGLTLREVADLLGHRRLTTTARYVHSVNSDGLVDKVAQLWV